MLDISRKNRNIVIRVYFKKSLRKGKCVNYFLQMSTIYIYIRKRLESKSKKLLMHRTS